MSRKSLLCIIIIITSIFPFVLFIFFPYIHRWSLLILPAFLIISVYPKWNVAILIALFLSTLKYTFVFIRPDFSSKVLFDLMIGTVENYLIFFTVAYFIIQRAQLLKEVQELTLIDQLTGAYNRRYFDLYLEKAIPVGERAELPIQLILLDIDYFKRINDMYGHILGDKVLKQLVEVIKGTIRVSDDLVRLGGEEFAVLVPQTTTEGCVLIAERLRHAVETANFVYKDTKVDVTISIGISKYEKGTSKTHLIEQADMALYQAKKNGRNQVVVKNHQL